MSFMSLGEMIIKALFRADIMVVLPVKQKQGKLWTLQRLRFSNSIPPPSSDVCPKHPRDETQLEAPRRETAPTALAPQVTLVPASLLRACRGYSGETVSSHCDHLLLLPVIAISRCSYFLFPLLLLIYVGHCN